MIIIDNLKFYTDIVDNSNSKMFNLDFQSDLILIRGNSGTGKSLIARYVASLIQSKQMPCDMAVIANFNIDIDITNTDELNDYITNKLKKFKNRFIIIDNADILLRDIDVRDYIANDTQNQYLILGRNHEYLTYSTKQIAKLKESGNEIILDYYMR